MDSQRVLELGSVALALFVPKVEQISWIRIRTSHTRSLLAIEVNRSDRRAFRISDEKAKFAIEWPQSDSRWLRPGRLPRLRVLVAFAAVAAVDLAPVTA